MAACHFLILPPYSPSFFTGVFYRIWDINLFNILMTGSAANSWVYEQPAQKKSKIPANYLCFQCFYEIVYWKIITVNAGFDMKLVLTKRVVILMDD